MDEFVTDSFQESEDRYHRLVENAMFGLLLYDMETIYLYNDYITRNLGYTDTDFSIGGITIWDIIHPQYRDRYHSVAVKRYSEKRNFFDRFTCELITKDSSVRSYEIACSSVTFHGKYAFQVNLVDITDRIMAEKASQRNMLRLQAAENKYRTLLNNLYDGFLIVNTGLRIYECNSAFAAMLGYSQQDILERNLLELAFQESDQLALLLGIQRRKKGQSDSYELNFKSRNGRKVQTHISPSPFFDEYGNIIGSYAVVKDLSILKEAEARNSYLAYLLGQISDGVIVTDSDAVIKYVNRSAEIILGTKGSEAIGRNAFHLIPLDVNRISEINDKVTKDGVWREELKYTTMDGNVKFLRISSVPIRDSNGQLTETVTVVSDFTEIIKSREVAEKASQAKTDFLANISHDLRTPMIGIMGASDLLGKEVMSPYQQELVTTIQQCGEQMLNLINDILDLSRIEAGFSIIAVKEFSLRQLINECIHIISPRVDAVKVFLTNYIDDTLPDYWLGDPVQIRRILLNLLSNAVKFTERGSVSLKVNSPNPLIMDDAGKLSLSFAVEDTGIGIPHDKLSSIFQAFQQIGSHPKEGTGLGLTISKHLIESMGGTIRVSSKLGMGSIFQFTLPLQPITEIQDTLKFGEENQTKEYDTAKYSILVVEDNSVNRKILSYLLQKMGHKVMTADNGLECLNLVEENNFDLIILDMKMPVMDGYEAAARIKSQPRFGHLPIIALTAYAIEGDALKCLQAGCDYYLTKPVDSEQLQSAIHKVMLIKGSPLSADVLETHFFNELLPEFLDSMDKLLADLEKSIVQKDVVQVLSAAHDIKGTAGMYGYSNISDLASQIYKTAKESQVEYTAPQFIMLQKLVNRIKASHQKV